MAMGSSIVIEAMPRYKLPGKSSNSKFPSKYPNKFKSTPSIISKNLRLQQDLPLRTRRKIPKMSASASPPRLYSPKRTTDGSGGRPRKQTRIDSGDIPTHFKGVRSPEKHGLEDLLPPLESLKLTREFDELAVRERFFCQRASLESLDDGNLDEDSRPFFESNWPAIIDYHKKLVRSIEIDLTKMPVAAQRGFENFSGVLCYRSSLLQSLLHIPELVFLLWAHSPNKCISSNGRDCLACNFRHLATSYWRVSSQAALQESFRRLHVVLRNRGWAHNGQADPDEMLSFFFKLLLEDQSTAANTQIDAIFMSVFSQKIVCPCGHISATIKKQAKITVSLAPRISDGTLRQYIIRGQQDAASGYRCGGCNQTQLVQKIGELDYSPDVLTVFISSVDQFARKIKHRVEIPDILDLTVLKSKSNTDSLKYELASLIQHRGGDHSGHYICSAAGPDGKWNMYDDRMVSKCGKGAINRHFTPVMCFYRRVVHVPSSLA